MLRWPNQIFLGFVQDMFVFLIIKMFGLSKIIILSINFVCLGNVFHLRHSQFMIQNLAEISDVLHRSLLL
jgi:hypothetical protein